ncbi:MAG: hypothetical protein ABMA13_18360 [Chthoniobacteraceae bacterium]
MSAPAWFIDVSSPSATGWLAGIGENTAGPDRRFVRDDVQPRRIHLLERAEADERIFSEIDPDTIDEIRVGVGPLDVAPTSGTFDLTANASGTGLAGLAYNITAAALETALNANAAVTTAGGVTVTKAGVLYTILLNVANTTLTLTADVTELGPPSQAQIANPIPAASGVRAQYTLRITQNFYAYSENWAARDDSADDVTITQIAAGSATAPARYSVAIAPDPIRGAFRLLSGETHVVKVRVQPNTAVAQVWTIAPVAVADFATGAYFDLPDNADTTERFWIDKDNGGASAPATPAGGSVTEITTINTGEDEFAVAAAIADALNAHGHFSATIDENALVTVTAASAGAKTASKTSAGSSHFTVSIATTGVAGQLQGQGFMLDDANGTAAVYVTVGGLPAAPPAWAAAATRAIPVAVAGGATASTAGGNIETALDSDGAWTSTNSSGLITITDASAGSRAGTTTVSSSAYFSTTISRAGFSIVATVDAFATRAAFESRLGGYWTVTKSAPFTWTLTRTVLGTPTAPTVEDDSLEWLIGWDGTLPFSTLALHTAFAATSAVSLSAVLEVKFTRTGESEQQALNVPCTLTRDLLASAITGSPDFSLSDSSTFKRGSEAIAMGETTAVIAFASSFATPPTTVLVSPVIKAASGDDDPPIAYAVHSIATTGFTVLLSGAAPEDCSLHWMALL